MSIRTYDMHPVTFGEVLAGLDIYRKGESYQETAAAILAELDMLAGGDGELARGQDVEYKLSDESARWRVGTFLRVNASRPGWALVIPEGMEAATVSVQRRHVRLAGGER